MRLTNSKNIRLKALVVDDDVISRQISAKMIEIIGMTVDTAENGQEALSLWQVKRHPLIITDCNMPTMDGFSLARAIRCTEKEEQIAQSTIIALTANSSEEKQTRCNQAGMNYFLTKPVTIEKLTPLIPRVSHTSLSSENETVKLDANLKQVPIDHTVLAEIFSDDKQAKVLQDLQQHVHANFSELTLLLQNTNLAKIESIAHRMAGACKMVGANNIANICTAIEDMAKNGHIAKDLILSSLDKSIQQFDDYLFRQLKQVQLSTSAKRGN